MNIKTSLNVLDDIKHQEIKEVFFNVLQWIESFNHRLKKKVKNSQQTIYQNKETNKKIHTKRRKMQQKEIPGVKRKKEKKKNKR